MAKRIISRFLDTNGDGTGTKSAIGDYSLAADDFYIEAGDNPLVISRLLVSAEDTTGMTAQEYGNLGAALTNGVSILAELDGTEYDLCDGVPIKTNAGWGTTCYDTQITGAAWGSGNDVLLVRWTFSKSGTPILLESGDKVIARVNDDLQGLLSHYFMIQGYEIY